MNDQLKTFLRGLLCSLVDLRLVDRYSRGSADNWSKWGDVRGRVWFALDLGLITCDQAFALFDLQVSAFRHQGKPFPCRVNAGPVIPVSVAHDRRKAAAVEVQPPVQAAEPAVVKVESKPKEGWGQPQLARRVHYFVSGMSLCRRWWYIGPTFKGLDYHENDCATCKRRLVVVKPQAQDLANERLEPVPAPPAPRELRLLCLLDETSPWDNPRFAPAAMLHRVPPFVGLQGRWPVGGGPCYQMRETFAVAPSAEVLERCVRQRSANALRANPGTVRSGRVTV